MDESSIIDAFYDALSVGDANAMVALYHPEVVFNDPAFGELRGERAKNMWRMLAARSKGRLKVSHWNVQVDGSSGSAQWRAEYEYGPKKRPIVNQIHASFEFRDGLIIKHTDAFNLWRWSSQALGTTGKLLGWSGFMRGKIQSATNKLLDKFEETELRQ